MAFRRKQISQSKTVGYRLKKARQRKGLTLEQAEDETKVRVKYLQAIESDNWKIFPNRVYVLGFIRRYARFVGYNEEKILGEFKREFGEYRTQIKKPRKKRWIDEVVITPKILVGVISAIVVLAVVGYIILSVRAISQPPQIEIISPIVEAVDVKDITIEGKTSETAVVDINGQLVSVDENGYFSQKVSLNEGVNNFKIISKNRIGSESVKELKLFYSKVPLPSATVTK